jgi:nitroreductase
MQLKEVIGSRRSIRYFDPDRPVEREKIQTILEAGLLASRAVNVAWGKGIVVYREQLTDEQRSSLHTPFASKEFDLAPVYILWYHDMDARRTAIDGSRYPAVASGVLQDIGALGPPHGWSRKYVEKVVLPEVLTPGLSAGPQRGGNPDAALALEQAYLAAVDEGLGGCLVPFDEAAAAKLFDVPDTWEAVLALVLGYPAEAPEAGGQRPRRTWETMIFDGHVDTPFVRDAQVVEQLRADGLIQEPAPIHWRQDEVRALSRWMEASDRADAGTAADPNDPLLELESVKQWWASYQQFWRSGPPPGEALDALRRFTEASGCKPDDIVDEVLRPAASGEGLMLRTRARRKYMDLVAEFEEREGSREAANYVRSFMIHNGIAMSPGIQR